MTYQNQERDIVQAYILLAPNIGQCTTKNRVMSDKGCFAADTVVRREIKKNVYKLPS